MSLKFSVSKKAPLWVQNTVAILLVLQASKGVIIDSMPLANDILKTQAGLWFDYIGNLLSVAFAVVSIFFAPRDQQ